MSRANEVPNTTSTTWSLEELSYRIIQKYFPGQLARISERLLRGVKPDQMYAEWLEAGDGLSAGIIKAAAEFIRSGGADALAQLDGGAICTACAAGSHDERCLKKNLSGQPCQCSCNPGGVAYAGKE